MDNDLYEELQAAVRDVFARRGQMAASDAVIIVETMEETGERVLVSSCGELSRWAILGHLDYIRGDIVGEMGRL